MLTALLLLACWTPPADAPAAEPLPPPPPAAPQVAIQADLHLDTPTQLHRQGVHMHAESGLEGGVKQLRAGGTNLAVEVLWPPRKADWRAHTFHLLELLERDIKAQEDLTLVRTPDQARQAAAAQQIGVLVSLEGAHGLGEDWRADLTELHSRGLGMLGLTWSLSNRFAGSSGDEGGGLTEDGQALVELARSLGVLIDLSHASRATTLEVCASSPVPVVASHSNAHALKAHVRNLTDEEIQCIAKTGGVIGVNLHRSFLGGTGDASAAADHVQHLAKVGGHGAVALGSDFDGLIKVPVDIPDAGSLGLIFAELRTRGWTEQQLLDLRGENFMRAWAAAQVSP